MLKNAFKHVLIIFVYKVSRFCKISLKAASPALCGWNHALLENCAVHGAGVMYGAEVTYHRGDVSAKAAPRFVNGKLLFIKVAFYILHSSIPMNTVARME